MSNEMQKFNHAIDNVELAEVLFMKQEKSRAISFITISILEFIVGFYDLSIALYDNALYFISAAFFFGAGVYILRVWLRKYKEATAFLKSYKSKVVNLKD